MNIRQFYQKAWAKNDERYENNCHFRKRSDQRRIWRGDFLLREIFFHFQLKNYLSSWGIIVKHLNSAWWEEREDKDNKKRSKTVHMSSSSECVGFHPSSFRLVSRRIRAFLAPTPLLPRVRRIEPTASRFAFCSQAHSSTIMNWGVENF